MFWLKYRKSIVFLWQDGLSRGQIFRHLFVHLNRSLPCISGIVDNLYFHVIPNRLIYRSEQEPLERFQKNNMGLPHWKYTKSFPSQKLSNTLSSKLLLFAIVSWRAVSQMYRKLFSSRLSLFNSTALAFLCAYIKHQTPLTTTNTASCVGASHLRACFIFQMFLLLFIE